MKLSDKEEYILNKMIESYEKTQERILKDALGITTGAALVIVHNAISELGSYIDILTRVLKEKS